jgi:hypothetical protein
MLALPCNVCRALRLPRRGSLPIDLAYRGDLAVQAVADYLTEANAATVIRDGDTVLLAVDNQWTRYVVDRHLATLNEVTLISGGNDETDGNVQLVRRHGGESLDGGLAEIHAEIGRATESEFAARNGCERQVEERPQLVVTNLMVASAMLNCLWAVLERGSVSYSEVYLDVIANAMSRARGCVRGSRRRRAVPTEVRTRPGRRHAALPGRSTQQNHIRTHP